MNRNCTRCGGEYAPYKTGEKEDPGAFYCILGNPKVKTEGVCQFDNPKSILYNAKGTA